jgi:hypothetical protein
MGSGDHSPLCRSVSFSIECIARVSGTEARESRNETMREIERGREIE